ncbi:MAG: recombinase family protein, partial [Clostridia bacterium]|nr:recombinase family protein [Clostridia bacterium]
DMTQQSHHKMLIDTFVNAIFLYDDKLMLGLNFHEGTTTITFDDLQETVENEGFGSDLNSVGAPLKVLENAYVSRAFSFFHVVTF